MKDIFNIFERTHPVIRIVLIALFLSILGILASAQYIGFDPFVALTTTVIIFITIILTFAGISVWGKIQNNRIQQCIKYFETNRYPSREHLINMSRSEFRMYIRGMLEKNEWISTNPHASLKKRGVDLIIGKYEKSTDNKEFYIKCSNQNVPISAYAITEFNTVLPTDRERVDGIFICPCGFTDEAQKQAIEHKIELWDYEHIYTTAGSTNI